MEFASVYHRSTDNYYYMLDENQLIINLKTGYDVKEVNIIHGDPFANGILGGGEEWTGQKSGIPFKIRLKYQQWWTTTIKPEFKRLKYYFELITDTEKWYYFEDGFVSEEQMNLKGRSRQCFTMPWMNPVDVNRVPKWVNDTVWYQIFPDRFCNGNPDINPENTKPWKYESGIGHNDFYGGDIQGIIDKLDYLSELGITGIYTTPINESPSNHKYDTTSYERIDSHFGDDRIMKIFVDEAHKRGMKVMIDAVFNHSGYYFEQWQDVLKNGRESEYFDWFMINEFPFSDKWDAARKGQLYTFAFFDSMPKLNTNNKKVRDYLISVACGWVNKYGVDGIRMDVANEVSHTFCKELRTALKEINPDLYLLGEIWHDAMPWLRGDEYDSVMNYPLAGSMKDFFIDKSLTGEDFEYMVNRCYTNYMQQTNDVLFNLLDSHDTIRLRNVVNSLDVYNSLLGLLFTMPGSVCIYYGTEIGMEGGFDPDCRRCMPWTDIEQGKYNEQISIIKQLVKLRKEEPLMRERNFHFPDEYKNPRVIQFQKMGWGEILEVIVNGSEEDIQVINDNDSKIVFSRGLEGDTLHKNGICIRYLSNKQNI
ncbi:MAG: glycoside hydrolase family 13 protein [Lachnospiraceae bacterium]|nr:glycoside hydrolase family 13 protein [Lachnospiraceae bacterium]